MNVASKAPVAACAAVTDTAGVGVPSQRTRTVASLMIELNSLASTRPVTSTSSPTFKGCGWTDRTSTPPVESCTKSAGEAKATMPRIVAVFDWPSEENRRLLTGSVFRLEGNACGMLFWSGIGDTSSLEESSADFGTAGGRDRC